jgi:hypothetical protein
VVLKLAVGVMTGSVAVVFEAVRSGVDLVDALIEYIAAKTSGKPADHENLRPDACLFRGERKAVPIPIII